MKRQRVSFVSLDLYVAQSISRKEGEVPFSHPCSSTSTKSFENQEISCAN